MDTIETFRIVNEMFSLTDSSSDTTSPSLSRAIQYRDQALLVGLEVGVFRGGDQLAGHVLLSQHLTALLLTVQDSLPGLVEEQLGDANLGGADRHGDSGRGCTMGLTKKVIL